MAHASMCLNGIAVNRQQGARLYSRQPWLQTLAFIEGAFLSSFLRRATSGKGISANGFNFQRLTVR